jgi:hypothetical protein
MGWLGGKPSPEKEQKVEKPDSKPQPPKGASSMIDKSECRRIGVLEMVQELVNSRRS